MIGHDFDGEDRTGPNRHRRPDWIDVHIGTRVRRRRMALAMTQTEFGTRLGITFQQVQKYERGTNRLSASTLYHAAHVLRVPVSYFFEGLSGWSGDEDPLSRTTLMVARRLRRLQPNIRRRFVRVLGVLSG